MIDLHTHSTCSDGSFTPEELVAHAKKTNLRAIALTDHDSVSGIRQFIEAGRGMKLKTLGGLEISLEHNNSSLHLLGYLTDNENEKLCDALLQIRDGRNERNRRIVAKLQETGAKITMEEVEAEAGGEVVGRPHFAKVLVRNGAVMTRQEAFDVYLARGAKAYVERFRLSVKEGVGLVREAGGVPVLAHPNMCGCNDNAELHQLLIDLIDGGLLGIEVWHSNHSDEETAQFLQLAKEFDLIATGGSDFHGAMNPGVALGYGKGQLRVPDEAADRLLEATTVDLAKCTNLG